MADIKLKVNGQEFAGWKSARVTRGIEAVAGSFELSVSDRWANQEKPWQIFEEDECELTIDGQVLITGWVDKRSLSYGAEEHSLSVSGRDRTGALVDCSAVLSKWEFKSLELLKLAEQLAKPFGIGVALGPGLVPRVSLKTGKAGGSVGGAGSAGKRSGLGLPKPQGKFSVNPGDSAFEVLDRACRLSGVLPISDGLGGLLLSRTGSTRATTELIEGKNILAASSEFDSSAKYRRYVVSGQSQGTDMLTGDVACAVKAEATDAGVKRSARVLFIRPEGGVSKESAKARGAWEASVRAARSASVSVTVQGWQQADGSLWPVNAVAHVKSPMIGIDGDMVITQATYTLDDGGTKTELTLKRPDSFIPEPTIAAKASSQFWPEIVKGV